MSQSPTCTRKIKSVIYWRFLFIDGSILQQWVTLSEFSRCPPPDQQRVITIGTNVWILNKHWQLYCSALLTPVSGWWDTNCSLRTLSRKAKYELIKSKIHPNICYCPGAAPCHRSSVNLTLGTKVLTRIQENKNPDSYVNHFFLPPIKNIHGSHMTSPLGPP